MQLNPSPSFRVGCLHTVAGNVAAFDGALLALDAPLVALEHTVRPELLAAAEEAGGLTPTIRAQTELALRHLAATCDGVLLTCSTLGPVADAMHAAVPVLRVDAALAQQAVANGGRVVALCAVETTVASTMALFEAAAAHTGARVEVRLVPGAWAHFKAGRLGEYFSALRQAADEAYDRGADVVALAQASMAGAARAARCGKTPLSSPLCGLAAAIGLLSSRSADGRPGGDGAG